MSHVRWEELLDEEEQASGAEQGAASGPPVPEGGVVPPEAMPEPVPGLAALEVPGVEAPGSPRLSLEQVAGEDPELAELLRERRQLEGRMNALLGVEDAPVDARLAKQFPVVEHTPETRIAERRQHERETAQRLLEQKLYARRRVEREEAERVEELRRRRVESGRAQRRKQGREAAKRQEQARKAQERVRLAARLAEQVMEANAGTAGRPRLPSQGLREVPGAVKPGRAVPRLPLALGKGTQGAGGARAGLDSLALGSLDTEALMERGLKMAGMDMESLMSMDGMDMEGMDMDMDGGGRGAKDE